MFTVEERKSVTAWLITSAHADPRIVSAAIVGAGALEPQDRWSDVDLSFGVRDGVAVTDVLGDWTRELAREQDAVALFDLQALTTVYRVFLLAGNLQVDLSFTPSSEFGPRGPRFRLLFGESIELYQAEGPSAQRVFGLAVHHAVRARVCIERERYWQAEYWISALRDHVLELACLRRGLEGDYGRGFDQLPTSIQDTAGAALVRSIDRDELLRALASAIPMLIDQAKADAGVELPALGGQLESQLVELLRPSLQA